MSTQKPMGVFFLLCCALGFLLANMADAAEEKAADSAPPPAMIEAAEIRAGLVEPMTEMVGTAYYARKATVATEVEGLVREVLFEQGARVGKGQVLIRLHDDILDTRITENEANLEQAKIEAELTGRDLERMEKLFHDRTISQSAYDQHLSRHKGAEQKIAALMAGRARLLLEKKKKEISAPFSGIIVSKMAEKGEWLNTGGPVALLADDSTVDVVIHVPQEMLAWLSAGRTVSVTCNSRAFDGRFINYIPEGDIATRTFAARIRLKNPTALAEGMEARAMMPAGPKKDALLVARDAVVSKQGQSVVFTISDNTAKMVPVSVTGYSGMDSGISGPGLAAGMKVVVRGNERLRDGQDVRYPGK